MKNKYNSKQNTFRRTGTTRFYKEEFVEVEIMTEIRPGDETIFIADWNGIVLSFPTSLIRANDLMIKDGKLKISKSMYDAWFREIQKKEIDEMNEKIYRYFNKIMKHSDIILNEEEFRNIRLPFLKSTILYSGEIHYTLGSLLDAWMENDDLSIFPSTYMVKINVSPCSGFNNYTAYSMTKKSLVTGTLTDKNKSWMSYINTFQSLMSNKKNNSDLLAVTRLLQELKID